MRSSSTRCSSETSSGGAASIDLMLAFYLPHVYQRRTTSPTVHHVDDVRVWLEEDSSVHIKAVTQSNDPIELSPGQARQLAAVLVELAERADH